YFSNSILIMLHAHDKHLDTGNNEWTMEIKDIRSPGVTTHTVTGFHEVFNRIDSEFGNRRWLGHLDRLVEYDVGVSLIRGDNTAAWYQLASGEYITPEGSFDTLVKNLDGSFTLTFKDGTRDEFDEDGFLIARLDRHGNGLTYGYTGGKLTSITDQLGDSITYAYTNGLLSSITDHAGRVTTFSYTNGLLTTMTEPDPDGGGPLSAPVTTYEYYGD